MARVLCILLSFACASVANAGRPANSLSNSTNGTAVNATQAQVQGGRASQGGRANAIDLQQGGRAGGGRAGAVESRVPLPKGPPPKTAAELKELKEMLPDHLWSKYGMTEQARTALLRGEELPMWEG